MPIQAVNFDWRKKFQWQLEMELPSGQSIAVAQIMKCGFPSAEIQKLAIKQLGSLVLVKHPTGIVYGDIVFERVLLTKDADLSIYQWFQQGANPLTGAGVRPGMLKRPFELVPVNGNGAAIERVKLGQAWCCKLEGSDFEGSSEAWAEKATICFETLDRQSATGEILS